MKKHVHRFSVLAIFVKFCCLATVGLSKAYSQCPNPITLTVKSITPSTCASNGIVQLGTNVPALSGNQPAVKFTLVNNPPAGATTSSQNDSTFTSLPPGNYTVRAECVNSSTNYVETTFTIDAQYTPMGALQASVESNCNLGKITITNATTIGGSAPLQFIVLPGNDADYTDALNAGYSPETIFPNLAPGDYTIRVKDNCGNIRTIVKTILATAVARDVSFSSSVDYNADCNNIKYTFSLYALVDPSTGNAVDASYYNQFGGIKVQLFEADANCNKNASMPLSDVFTWMTDSANSIGVTPSSTKNYYVEVTTPPCNTVYGRCVNYSNMYLDPELSLVTTSAGCNTGVSPATMTIGFDYNHNLIYPLHAIITNSIGTVIKDTSEITNIKNVAFKNLPHDAYTIKVYDKCGNLIKDEVITDVTGNGSPALGIVSLSLDCVKTEGTENVTLRFTGYLPGLSEASEVKIVDVSDKLKNHSDYNYMGNIGYLDGANGFITFDTLRPGTYQIQITTPCGPVILPYTVNGTDPTLVQKIAAQSTSTCSSGGNVSIISSQTKYTGWGTPNYILMNATTNTKVDFPGIENPNTIGSWANLPDGDYKINLHITSSYCSEGTGADYDIASNTVSIFSQNRPPVVTKKLGSICEDPITGALQTTGTAYLEFDGVPPFKLEYKPHTSSTWLLVSNGASSPASIGNLLPYADYDIKVTSCGASTETSVTIGQLAPYRITYSANPCENLPFTMTLPLSTGVTYEWKNPAGKVVSTSNTLSFDPYTAANNDQYSSIVSFGGCVIRKDTVILSSAQCGLTLPIRLTDFSAKSVNCKTILNWNIINQQTDKYFVVEASVNGKDFTVIKSIPVLPNNDAYTYIDPSRNGYKYYRLKMIDLDGSFLYSQVKEISGCEQENTSGVFSLAPNPVSAGHSVNLLYNGETVTGHYELFNMLGSKISSGNNITLGTAGVNKLNIVLPQLSKGVYIVSFITTAGKAVGHEKLVVQ